MITNELPNSRMAIKIKFRRHSFMLRWRRWRHRFSIIWNCRKKKRDRKTESRKKQFEIEGHRAKIQGGHRALHVCVHTHLRWYYKKDGVKKRLEVDCRGKRRRRNIPPTQPFLKTTTMMTAMSPMTWKTRNSRSLNKKLRRRKSTVLSAIKSISLMV